MQLFATDQENNEKLNTFTSQGLRWKRLRTISNPSFTTGKLRIIEPLINSHVIEMLDQITDQNGKQIDIFLYGFLFILV